MSISYATPITTVSTDIDAVGGKHAYVGMLREDQDGKEYTLLLAGGAIAKYTALGIVSGVIEELQDATTPVMGMNTTGSTLSSGQYFWGQTYGLYEFAKHENDVTINQFVKAGSNSPSLDGDDAATAGSYYVGWCVEVVSAGTIKVFIDPFSVTDAA